MVSILYGIIVTLVYEVGCLFACLFVLKRSSYILIDNIGLICKCCSSEPDLQSAWILIHTMTGKMAILAEVFMISLGHPCRCHSNGLKQARTIFTSFPIHHL